jgi:aspartate ammonia-lyase
MEKTNSKFRTEKDALGSVKVPKEAYFGSYTARSKKNFQISTLTAPNVFRESLGTVKLAAAKSNYSLGLLTKKEYEAIEKACEEFISGKFNEEFTLDIFQAGAGTSYNMNANEIIANRANELLKGTKGEYEFIHPNNQVNLAQSTNDVIPTATKIAALTLIPNLIKEIKDLEKEIGKNQIQYKNLVKAGRTHLQDAVPITVGQELDSFREAIKKSQKFIEEQSKELQVLGIGGTAVGTGINTDPMYKKLIINNLSLLTGIKFTKANNSTEIANNMNSFMNFSSSLRSLAINLINISQNLMLMNMGPKTGISEVSLPEVQPGSSIMPGKINPSIPEATIMTCLQVLGNDKTIEEAASKSQFELNVMCPIIMYNLLQSIEIITNATRTFREKCIKDLKYNKERIEKLLEKSLCNATSLVPYLGYQKTAEVVKSALKNESTLKEELVNQGLFTKNELKDLLSKEQTTTPSRINKKLIRKSLN